MKKLLLGLLVLGLSLTVCSTVYAETLEFNSSSGSEISTGKTDWEYARSTVPSIPSENYLQIETSWYNGAYDIYRTLLSFTPGMSGEVTEVNLILESSGVIYNQENVDIVVVSPTTLEELSRVPLSSFVDGNSVVISLPLYIANSGTVNLLLITSLDFSRTPPSGWNWMTLDRVTHAPKLEIIRDGESSVYVPYTSTESTPVVSSEEGVSTPVLNSAVSVEDVGYPIWYSYALFGLAIVILVVYCLYLKRVER